MPFSRDTILAAASDEDLLSLEMACRAERRSRALIPLESRSLNPSRDPHPTAEEIAIYREQGIIKAIKAYRERGVDCSLSEAKRVFESLPHSLTGR